MPKDIKTENFRKWLEMRKYVQLNNDAFDYYNMMIENISPMLVYPSLTENGIEMQTLIEYAAAQGVGAVCEIDGEFRCGFLKWSDILNDNGVAKTCIITGSYWSKEFETKDIAYFRFNHSQQPATHLQWFSRMFANVDDSQRCLVRNTKYAPMPVVATTTEQQKYEDAMKRQQRGEDITVIVSPTSNPLFSAGATQKRESDKILNLGDPAMIEKMHFLSEYHAELKKRFGAMYGMCFKSSSKSAQETLDEIHGMDNFSLIVPYNMKAEMQLFADKCARLWNWGGRDSVRFSELWEREDNDAKHGENEKKEGVNDAEPVENNEAGENPSV